MPHRPDIDTVDVDAVRRVLDDGGVVAIPSESSYGLAVDPRNQAGVEAIYTIKGRDAGKALPVVAADVDQVVELGVHPGAPELAVGQRFWPAPLSLLLPLAEPLPASAGERTLAVRVPAHDLLRKLLEALGSALTATSANRSGEPPILDPAALDALLAGRRAIVVNGGILPGGPPSTLAAWPGGKLRVLRQGAFPAERLPQELP